MFLVFVCAEFGCNIVQVGLFFAESLCSIINMFLQSLGVVLQFCFCRV